MNKRTLGTAKAQGGDVVSEIGLGTYHLTSDKGVPRDEALRVVERALLLGVNVIDTAPLYGRGESEEILGIALEGRPEPHFLATKVGHLEKAEDYRSFDAIMRQFERGLKLLRRESVDALQVHEADWGHWWEGSAIEDAPVLQVLRRLKEEGRVRFIGITSNHAEPLAKLLAAYDFDVVLVANRYTLLWQDAADALLPLAKQKGTAVIIGAPFHQAAFSARHPEWLMNPPAWVTPGRLEQFKKLYALLDRIDMPIAELSLRFILRDARVHVVIPGSSRVSELEANVAVSGKEGLHPEILEALAEINRIEA